MDIILQLLPELLLEPPAERAYYATTEPAFARYHLAAARAGHKLRAAKDTPAAYAVYLAELETAWVQLEQARQEALAVYEQAAGEETGSAP